MFWGVRLSAEEDNLLAAWSWAIGTGNVGTAFQIMARFAPVEVWSTYPLLLAGEAALELPGASEHPSYPLALAVTALFASIRAHVTGAEELCRWVAEASARQDTPDWRVEEAICAARSSMRPRPARSPTPPAWPSRPLASPRPVVPRRRPRRAHHRRGRSRARR